MSLLDRALVRALPAVPRPVVRRLSARYIAGPELSDACTVARELNDQGKKATLDVLGEEVHARSEARALVKAYLEALAAIDRAGLDAGVSVKPTGLGLKLDRDYCRHNISTLARAAAERGRFVRIDMEDSSTTSDTLAVYRELRGDGIDNVGIVLQATLRRTIDDVYALADLRPSVRLCKGIYVEPPGLAHRGYETVRFNFVKTLEALLDCGATVAIATHDEYLLEEGKRLVRERGLEPDEYEFQMLLGVRPDPGDALVREGHHLRIYIPYGRQWCEYSLRRLQENPRIATYVALDTVRRFVPGRDSA